MIDRDKLQRNLFISRKKDNEEVRITPLADDDFIIPSYYGIIYKTINNGSIEIAHGYIANLYEYIKDKNEIKRNTHQSQFIKIEKINKLKHYQRFCAMLFIILRIIMTGNL